MELKDAILERKSIRGYLDKPIPKEVLEDVLRLGTRAVSALNSQPWEFIVLTGDIMKKIGADNADCYVTGVPEDISDPPLDGIYRRRMIDIAKQLFAEMDIARENTEKREWWTQRGFRFFDAPAVILVMTDDSLEDAPTNFDLGAVVQNITLAAMEYGLGTCVEQQAVNYLRGIRKYLDIPEGKRFVVGIAIGYEDPDFPANRVVSQRADLADNTTWYGFE